MKCKNCQSEMESINKDWGQSCSSETFWCQGCGTLCTKWDHFNFLPSDKCEWKEPKSVETTKRLTDALIRAQDRSSNVVARLNRMSRDEMDRVDWGEDDRR